MASIAAEHRLMSAMDAIEIADGEHCAFRSCRHIPPTGDDIHPCFLSECAIASLLERDTFYALSLRCSSATFSARYRFAT
jgi:hypothetical protein